MRAPSGLILRAVACYSVRDLIPLYAVYALLFRDHGLSAAAVASLFAIWSLTQFVFEVPSGAWADVVSRRLLLVLSGLLYAAAFALWMLVPVYAGFAAGFVLWGLSGALLSGTFEALLYDELAAVGAEDRYAQAMGWSESGSVAAQLAGTLAAAPLFALGGYALVGWTSVGMALLQTLVALSLPAAPKRTAAEPALEISGDTVPGLGARYVAMLRAGLAEAARTPAVARGVLLLALLMGLLATDEFAPLVARDGGMATGTVALAMAALLAGWGLGTALGGRTWRARGRLVGAGLALGAALLAAGALEGGVLGFGVMAAGYALGANAMVVADARLQHAIAGPARATVTSAAGLLSELVAVVVFALATLGAQRVDAAVLVAVLAVPLAAVGLLAGRLLPPLGDQEERSSISHR